MSRSLMTVGVLLASVSLAEAENTATFSPELRDAPVASLAAAPLAAAAAVEAPASGRGKTTKRKTRVARARASKTMADAAAAVGAAAVKSLTIGGIPAPLPPLHDKAEVADAVATLEVPPTRGGGNTEPASATPGSAAAARGPREAAAETVAALLAKHAMDNGVPLKLAQAVVRIESRGNARASNHGALGLMQIKYGTARAVGFDGPAVALFVADTNLRYGMKVLAQAWRAAGGDLCGALMRYQSGHYATHMSAANRAYCSRARAIMAGA